MTTTVGTVSNKAFADALYTRGTAEIAVAHGYVSEADNVQLKADGIHVQPYWVLHPGVHDPIVEPDLGESVVEGAWTWQITAVGATRNDVLDLTDQIRAAYFRWVPDVAGLVLGPCLTPPGYQPLVLVDRDVTPHRLFVPMQFTNTATATTTTT